MSYRKPSYKEIIISKVITVIFLVYIITSMLYGPLTKFGEWLDRNARLEYAQRGWDLGFYAYAHFLITIGIFIFQIFLIKILIFPKKSKIHFTNFYRGFHPFFLDKNQKKNLINIIGFPIFLSIVILVHILSGEATKKTAIYVLNFVYHLSIIQLIIERQEIINTFPVNFMKSNSLRLIVKYQDYINHKIADDEPHLTINQNFDVSLKSLPRNDSEKNLIEIKNPNTPINPALVYKIEDKDLADALRNGFVLRAKLIEIKEEGNLEIELSLRKPFDFFMEDKIKKYAKNWAKIINETEANEKTTESSYFFYNEEIEKFKKEGWILSSELKDEQKFNDVSRINGQDWYKIKLLN